jgi:light-regulated signal transduction histidine kinase (bacteriophytochrome)
MTFATQGAIRMEALLKDLLAYSRAATHPSEDVASRETNSQGALNEALVNLGGVIEETKAQLSSAELPNVRMPRVHLVQIFQNLIGNALKYRRTGERPAIHVDVRRKNGAWIFSVRDNGIGIDPQYQQHVFRIFGRLHGQEVSGTGVGLAICKKLVERAGGAIWVESQLGAGSTFLFTVRL